MTFAVVSEIRLARRRSTTLSALERRHLLHRIVKALDALQDAPLAAAPGFDRRPIDSIILSTTHALGEIATMAEDDFRTVICEFDILFSRLADTLLDGIAPVSAERH